MTELKGMVNGVEVIVTVRKLTYGEYKEILRKVSSEAQITNGIMKSNINPVKFQELLVDASAKPNTGTLNDLPIDFGMRVEEEVMRVNNFSTDSFQDSK